MNTRRTERPDWTLINGDSIEVLSEQARESIDLSVYSPPFASLYTYTASERDLGNCASAEEFFAHYAFLIREVLRVTKPGRLTCVHVAQIAAMLERDGYIGLKDFRGDVIRAYLEAGWIYHGEVCIDKNPQSQAIRTKAKGLLFVQMKKDSTWSRPALADYILVFRKPGENATPVTHDESRPLAALSNEDWIEWAHPLWRHAVWAPSDLSRQDLDTWARGVWYGIRESDTLQVTEARHEDDERHICPLQLGTIERCVRLWSNPGDLILSPFAGIGSEGYEAIRLGRRYLGIELKPSYYDVAVKNLHAAEQARGQGVLFGAEVSA